MNYTFWLDTVDTVDTAFLVSVRNCVVLIESNFLEIPEMVDC